MIGESIDLFRFPFHSLENCLLLVHRSSSSGTRIPSCPCRPAWRSQLSSSSRPRVYKSSKTRWSCALTTKKSKFRSELFPLSPRSKSKASDSNSGSLEAQSLQLVLFFLLCAEIVDFGVQSASNKTISSKLRISNVGAVAGEFSIAYKGKLPLTFVPNKEIVQPFSETIVRVDFFTNIAAQIEEKVK